MNDMECKQAIIEAMQRFGDGDLAENAVHLLGVLGYRSELTLELSGDVADFIAQFPAGKPDTVGEQAFRRDAQSVRILFQLTDAEITTVQSGLFDAKQFNGGNNKSFLFVAVELKGERYVRGEYAQFTREINKRFLMPVVVLFKTADQLITLSFVHRRPHKKDPKRDVLGSVSLIREIAPYDPHRAHLDILAELSLSERLQWMDANGKPHNFDGLLAAWLDTLDIEKLNKRFYKDLFAWFETAVSEARFPTRERKVLKPEEHIIRLITRLLFVWFIKEKRLVAEDLFVEAHVKKLLKDYDREGGDSYYRAVLQNLFFATLNTEIDKRGFSKKSNTTHRDFSRYRYKRELAGPDALLDLFRETPFINGGLFDCLDSEVATGDGGYRIDCFSDNPRHGADLFSIPNGLFFSDDGLISLFNRYKFTVEENTPIEQEVALDPELLGKVFENLLAAYNPETRETVRKQTGSYYTPREVVDYMVDEALVATLAEKCSPADADVDFYRDRLRYLLDYEDAFEDAHELFEEAEKRDIVRIISEIKVLDPAVGSGAFPMGVLHKLTLALRRLDPYNQRWEDLQKAQAQTRAQAAFDTRDQSERDAELKEISNTFERYRDSDFGRKLYLIQNSIFGVDIQTIATQIAKLRFFISLAIEQEPDETAENFGIKPLPNLETRFVTANTLLGLEKPVQLSLGQTAAVKDLERQLSENREQHFHATTRSKKLECWKRDGRLRSELAAKLEQDGWAAGDADKVAGWDPYDQNAVADWFDAEYMFGVTDGFDVVIGNPPYVSHDRIPKQLKEKIEDHYQSYQPFADMYCYFIEKAIELQNRRGILSFITSNSYLRAEYGEPIRRFLRNNNILLRMLSIEDLQVFESVIVNVAIIISCKSKNITDNLCIIVNLPFSGASFEDFVKSNSFNCPQSYFNSKSWNLVEPQLIEFQRKLESSGKTLEQLGTKIRLGIATGMNKAFLIGENKKRALCQKNPINAKIIKPILRGRDIARYRYTLSGQHIILAKNGVNVKTDYPEIYRHLVSFGDKFRNRGAQGQHWTNLRACSFYDDFKKEKIVWIELTDLGRFALCNEEVYLLNSAYFLLPPSGMDSKFLLGVLNSSTIRFYLGLVAETSGMGTSRWINNYVKEFPIPTVASEQQVPIIKIVDKILDAKRSDPNTDVSVLEQEVDQVVYSLYGLTPEEIAIVEEE